jgi:hypothetical protein
MHPPERQGGRYKGKHHEGLRPLSNKSGWRGFLRASEQEKPRPPS